MEIVSFEIAQKLKEKGFKEKCFAYYASYDATLFYNKSNFRGGIVDDCLYSYNSLRESVSTSELIDAPTISQVLKWLREEKKLFVQISLFQYCYDYCILDTEMVYYDNEHKVLHQGPTGYSYNEAVLAAIEYVLDNLI